MHSVIMCKGMWHRVFCTLVLFIQELYCKDRALHAQLGLPCFTLPIFNIYVYTTYSVNDFFTGLKTLIFSVIKNLRYMHTGLVV